MGWCTPLNLSTFEAEFKASLVYKVITSATQKDPVSTPYSQKGQTKPTVFVRVSVAVERCHDQGNSYKGKENI